MLTAFNVHITHELCLSYGSGRGDVGEGEGVVITSRLHFNNRGQSLQSSKWRRADDFYFPSKFCTSKFSVYNLIFVLKQLVVFLIFLFPFSYKKCWFCFSIFFHRFCKLLFCLQAVLLLSRSRTHSHTHTRLHA